MTVSDFTHGSRWEPTVAWGGPTDEVTLYDGPVRLRRGDEVTKPLPGQVRLLLRGGTSLEWSAAVPPDDWHVSRQWRFTTHERDAALEFTHDGISVSLPVHVTGSGRGILRGATFGTPSPQPCQSLRATVFGLGRLHAGDYLYDDHDEPFLRHKVEFDGWVVTFDERDDHAAVVPAASQARLPVATHALEVHRLDDQPFDATTADDLLEGLTYGLSFAMDRWVALVAVKGLDAPGSVVW